MLLRTRSSRAVTGLAALVLLAAGCGDSAGGVVSGANVDYRNGLVNIEDAGEPVQGGSITFAAYTEEAQLDPARIIVAGSTGGVELAAIYDVLMRWDSARNEVVPQLAESLTPDDDYTVWTLDLRDGVTFSDGTPLDSAAVAASLERFAGAGATESSVWNSNVRRIETPDPGTVVFHLATRWPGFDYMFTTAPGMIVAPSADAGDQFTPIGAGAFTLGRYRPQEELVLEANPGYWGGPPNLDSVRVVYLNDPTTTLDSFRAGAIDLTYLKDPDLVDHALDEGTAGFLNMVARGNSALINAEEGRAGSDPRVRKALHLAVPPDAVITRAFGGAGVSGNDICPDYSTWHTGTEPLAYDPEEARRLVAEAKADGFDGRITHIDASDASSRDTALTLKGAWEAVGFDVEPVYVRTIADQITRIQVDRDYDTAGWGLGWREAGPYARMFTTLHSEGNAANGMVTGDFDELIAEFQAADDTDEQRRIMGRIQEKWNDVVPALIFAPSPEFMMFGADLHGVVDTTNSMVLLHEAWTSGS